MALNTCEMWFNGIKIAVFSKKLTKNRPKIADAWLEKVTNCITLSKRSHTKTWFSKLRVICKFSAFFPSLPQNLEYLFIRQVVKKVNFDPWYNINTLLYVFQPYTAYSLSEAQVLPLGMGISEQ